MRLWPAGRLSGRPDVGLKAGLQPLLTPAEIAALAAQAEFLARLPQRREVHDHHAGDWPSARLGRGLDFEESRPYAPGDDVRDMDWRTSARLSHPYVKTYREERQPMLHLALDRGPAMRFGTRRRLKAAQAARLAVLAAFAAAARNAAVSATVWEEPDRELPARHGRPGALAIARAAAADVGSPAALQPERHPNHPARLNRLAAELPRGARLLLLTDLAWLTPACARPLALLGERCDVTVLHIIDPLERTLPDVGLARIHDLAAGATRWLDTRHAAPAHAAAFQARLEAARALLARAGIAHRLVGSEEDDLAPHLLAGLARHA